MPGIVVFNRRWGVGSDDLVIPAIVMAVLHTIWIIILGAVLGLADFDPDTGTILAGCGTALRNLIIGFLALVCGSAAIELAAAGVSMRGTILNPQPRAAMSCLLYTRLAILLVEFVWQVLGVIWLVRYYSSCAGVGAKRALLGVIVCNIIATICILLSVWCTFDSAGRSWVKMKRYQESLKGREPRAHQKRCSGSSRRNWRHRKAMRKYEQSWDRRCRFLFCCIKEDRHRNSFAEIAKLFTEFFRDLDVVPSDVVAGLVLLRKHQQLHRKFVISQGSNDIYEYLSGVPITPATPFVDVTHDDVRDEYGRIVHYMRYALAAYGWPIYIMMNTGMGLCRIMPSLRCCCCCCCSGAKTTWRTLLVDDNCCRCNFAALQQLTGLKHMDIIYATYHVDIGETPFYIAVDHDKRTVVISIRGTLSLQDVLTDLKADAEILPIEPMKEDWLAHKGMVQAAAYIYKKIKDENLLAAAFNINTDKASGDYDVVVVGHSLGAGTAAILAILMRQEYPTLHCYSYSPPGGLLSAKCVEETKSFITSVVVGKDVVPRIGLHQLEAFRQDLINVIKKSTEPKWKIIGGSVICCSCRGDEDADNSMTTVTVEMSELMRQDKEARSFIHPGDAQISLSAHTPLFLPGKILHVVRSHERLRSSILPCGGDEPLYQALWANNADFDQVLISPTMANDHMPDKVLEALERVLIDYALIQRRSPDVATTTSTATDVRPPPQPSSAAQYACLIDIDNELACSSTSPDLPSSAAAIACKPSELILIPDTSITGSAEHTTVVRSPSGCYIEPRYPHLKAKLEQLPLPVAADTAVTSLEGLVDSGGAPYRYSLDPPSPVGYPDETPAPEVTPISATEPKKFLWSDTNSAPQPLSGVSDVKPEDIGVGHAQNGGIRPSEAATNKDLIVVNGGGTSSENSAAFLVNGIGDRHRAENSRSLFGNSRQCSDSDDQQQYLYDAFFGHYSPAGRGYPHGLHECTDCRFLPVGPTALKTSDIGPAGTCGLVNGGSLEVCGNLENGVSLNGTGNTLSNNHSGLILSDDNEDSKFNDAS